ncbi:methyltransferase domain-containing protein [Pseudonocardia sp.]|uniref:class I SAM-dependent methyltransferase n=1 Tax=Pseudonocardia sp. TaxID=60912 RepID=UPI002616A12E|nr:methyltransferase domain-containing protein [Pseudonocardia sp.]
MTTQQAPGLEQIRDAWNAVADGFDRFVTPESMVLGREVVLRLGLRPGTRLLDVGAGSGALTIPAARIGADVVATDLAPAMIERLTARALAEGLSSVRGRIMDGNALDLDDDTFDVAASVNGVSVFPDMERGLAELVRVTRPGGRVVIAAFGPLPTVEFIVFCAGAVRAAVPGAMPLPTDPPPLPFQAAHPDVLRERMVDAGLREIRIDPFTWESAFDSARHLWDTFTASHPIGAQTAAALDDGQQAEVVRVLEGTLRERSAGAPGAVLSAQVNIGTGTVC